MLAERVVDNTNPLNLSTNKCETLPDEAAATKLAYNYGFLAGYKGPISVTRVYVAVEGVMLRHGASAAGGRAGLGTSTGRNQLDEEWT